MKEYISKLPPIRAYHSLSKEHRYVYTHVCMQTFLGNLYAGLLYGMGSIADAISKQFSPQHYSEFSYKHGTFGAIIIVLLSSAPMPILQWIVVEKKLIDDKSLQWIGYITVIISLVLAGVSLKIKNLVLFYLG